MSSAAKIQLKDKIIDDAALVSFIDQCIGQYGGFQAARDHFEEAGLGEAIRDTYQITKDASYSKTSIIDLSNYKAAEIHALCNNAIESLLEAEDLEIIMPLTKSEATDLLAKIDA